MKLPRPRRLFGLALLGASLGFSAVSASFAAKRSPEAEAARFLSSYEVVSFPARDGVKLSGWFVPCENAKCAVVLLHGNGSRRTQMLARAKLLHDNGYAVLLYDARGHGESEDKHVSFGWFETRDLLGAMDWLRTRGFAEFGCLGVSQGGATIVFAAAQLKDVRWVVLESVYPTLQTAIDRRFYHAFATVGWITGRLLTPLASLWTGVSVSEITPVTHIAELRCPVLIMSGDQDNYTLPSDARELFAHASEPKSFWLVAGAAHVDLYGFGKQDYERHLLSFLAGIH